MTKPALPTLEGAACALLLEIKRTTDIGLGVLSIGVGKNFICVYAHERITWWKPPKSYMGYPVKFRQVGPIMPLGISA